jgi:pantoate--beta-alanine ligase
VKHIKQITNEMLQEKLFFIPTMGSLHRGHLSLIENAKQFELKIVVSIFVNPKQFNDSNDFKKYPRDIEKDFDILNNSKIDYLFTPDKEYVYGQNFKNIIHSGSIGKKYEGKSRPGHFDGVLTVVNRLFELVQPRKAIFGKKDAQQLFLIKQYVGKNNLDIELLEGDIIRDSNGLALSSRNQLLSDQGLVAATGLKRHLDTLKEEYLQTRDVNQSINYALEQNKDRNLTVDYLHILDKNTFSKLTEETTNAIIIIAGYVEGIRLIDNIDFRVEI